MLKQVLHQQVMHQYQPRRAGRALKADYDGTRARCSSPRQTAPLTAQDSGQDTVLSERPAEARKRFARRPRADCSRSKTECASLKSSRLYKTQGTVTLNKGWSDVLVYTFAAAC